MFAQMYVSRCLQTTASSMSMVITSPLSLKKSLRPWFTSLIGHSDHVYSEILPKQSQCSSQSPTAAPVHPDVRVSGEHLHVVSEYKYLSVILHSKRTFKSHMEMVSDGIKFNLSSFPHAASVLSLFVHFLQIFFHVSCMFYFESCSALLLPAPWLRFLTRSEDCGEELSWRMDSTKSNIQNL